MVLQADLTLEKTIESMIAFSPTYMSQTLSILSEISSLKLENAGSKLKKSLQFLRMLRSGGSYIPEEISRRIESVFGVKLQTLYGATECSPMMFNDQSVSGKASALGLPVKGMDTKVNNQKQ